MCVNVVKDQKNVCRKYVLIVWYIYKVFESNVNASVKLLLILMIKVPRIGIILGGRTGHFLSINH